MIKQASRRTHNAPAAKAGSVREGKPITSDLTERPCRQAIAPAPSPAPNPSTETTPAGAGRLAAIGVQPACEAASPEAAPMPLSHPHRRASILVADDERRIRLAIRSCLEAEGYTIYEACDGTEALNQVLLHAPDLMILDLAMPNLDGMRTLRELNALHGQLKPRVVMLTAFGSMPTAASAIGLGAAAFVEKPLVPEALRQLVARVLAEPPDADDHLGIPIDWPTDPQ